MTNEAAIDPAMVKWEEDYPDTYFGPKRSDWLRMSAMFSGENPYAVVETQDEQAALKEMVQQMPDPAAEERKIAVTAYMSRMKRQNIDFVYDNLDGILKDYYGRKTNVDEAFKDISGMLLRGRGDDTPKEGEDIFLSAGSGIAGAVDFGLSVAKFFARYGIPHDVTKDNPFEGFVKTVRKPVKEYRTSLSEWAKTKTLEDAWKEGETGKNLVKLVAEEGPSLAEQIGFIYLTGGVGPFLMGGVFTEEKREQLLEENPEMSFGQMAANLSATYVINTVDALIDRGILKGATAPLKKELTESVFYAFKRIVAPTFIEGGTEGLQRLAENVADYLTGVYDKEIAQGAKVSDLLVRGVPEEALLGAFGGAGMSALGFTTIRDIDRMNNALITTVDSTIERLRAKESPTDAELKQLHELEEMRDAGNVEGMRAVLMQRAIGEHNRIQREQGTDAKNESEMTVEDFAERAREQYRQRHSELAHNPEETLAVVTEASKLYPDYEFQCFDGAENIPDAARQEAAARRLDVRGVDAVIIGNTCYVNTAKLRPSDVPKRVLEEVAGHRGIRAVFGDQYDSMLDGVYRDFFDTEEFREVVQRYFRGRKLESVDDQRYATEEFLAHNARMRPELKPTWWKSFLERVKMALRKLPGFHNLRFTDRELERILIRGIGAVRKGKSEGNAEGGETRFCIDGETKTFSLSELLQRFKDELSGTELNAEQQGIYDVVTGESKKTVIRKEDLETLEEFVLLKGGRGKGAKKIIQVHYAGVRGPVTALEIVNIGDVIRRGTYIPGDEAHPTSRSYELTADDGARLRVVVDYDKQKNKSVINFYSNRKNGNRAHEASSGSITDLRITIAPESGKVKHSPEGGARFSIIGEEGAGRGREAEARMSGLRIAREMEAAGKDAKTIKRATGWERGGDGKWRMEIPDLKIKREETLPDGTTYAKSEFSLKFHDGALGEYVDAPELFEAYPELRNIRLAVRPEEMSDTGFSYGYFDKSRNMIVVYSDVSHAEEALVHEVQHAIQALEGFPGGGDGREMGAEYWKLAGEVEAYNAAKRRKMTAEEKRESLLEETADVAEEDKIYLDGAQGLEHSFAEDNFYYQKALDAYFRGEWHAEKSLPLAVRTPDIYLRLKLKDKGFVIKNIPWSLAYSAVRKGLGKQVSSSNGEAHWLRPEDFKKLPDAIYHPVMILDSNTDKSLEIITDLFDQNGKPVLLALRLDVEEEHHKVNSIRSVYGKDNVNTLINKLLDGRGRYVDMKRAANWSQSIRVQFPEEVLLKSRSPYIIIENGEKSSEGDTKSEKNLRFSIEQYSDADWSDMVTYMKAKVGDLLTKSDAEYKKMLESVGMECYSEADAHACAVEAMNANLEDAKARRKEEMMKWIVENNTWIQRIAEVTGSPEFKIRPSYRFQGMDFTGAYISQAWRDCSGNPKAKNREKRLKEASGYHSDELAQMIADKYGGDAIEIENDLIEYFQHKKKKASKTERENGELGVYDEYYAFKKEERLFNRELDRQMQEQWESQEAVRIGDEIRNILEEKRVIGEELAETDFELFASLYQQVTGERAPAHPSAEQLDALNMAIQEGGVTQAYIRGWEAGRDRMLAEKRKEFAEFTAKVMQEKTAMKEHYKEQISKEREKRRKQADKFAAERANIREANLERQEELARDNARKLHLQREANLERQEEMVRDDADKLYLQHQAEEFAKKNVPAEQRGEFIRGIVDLAKYSYLPTKKYPNGQRKAKLQELFERMAARGEEVRKEKLIEGTEKLFKQAGLRADATRKQRNVLSFDVQRIVDRCREYADLSAEETETLSSELAQQIDNTELTGNALADLEYEARLLDLFGNYRGKSASEIELARAELKTLVNTGRSELKQEIRERVQADGLARSDITAGLLNGENPLTPQQRRALEAKRKREKTKRVLAETNWKSNSLDSLLSYLELPSGGKVETVEELQRKLYRSNDGKMTRSRKHAEELEAKLNEFCGVDPAKRDSFTARKARAELIRKWRERPEKTGIIRGQPNEMTQYMKWVRVPADQAQAKLKEFQAQGREVEAAALEHLLNTERLRIKRGDVTSGDAVTDALVKEMRKMQESDQEKAYFIPELRLGANPVEEKLTQLEALYMRLMWGQKNVKYKMRFNGWTESSMKQIDAYLKPEVKEFGEWMVKQLERDRADIEAVYEKLYFSMFPHEENYFPSVYNPTRETIDGRMTTDLSQEGAGKQPMAYTPGAVKLRAFHLMEPKICDALNVFVNHRMQMDHFVTHGETSRELRSIFANRDVAQTIRDVYGGEYYDQLRKEISDFIHGGNTEVQNTQFAQMALNNFTRMKMLWNLVSAGKQVFGGISYFAFSGVPAKAMAAGIVDFWKHPAENAKRLLETEYFKNRWQGGMNREMKAIMDSTGLCAGNMQLFLRELDHAGFMLMRAGDAFPVLVYGHAVYKYHYEQLVKQGLAPHEADIRAKEEWALATERTQQSGAPHMLNSWQKGNFAQKALVSFLSNPTLLFQSYSRDIYSQKRFGHGGWSAAKKIAVAGICSVLMSAINQMIRNGDDWDEYSLSDAVFSVLNDITVGWVGVGTLMSGIYDALSYGRAKTIPVLDDAGRAVRSGYRIAGEMAEGDLNEENLRDAIALLQGLGLFWSPAAQVSALGREGRRWWQFFTGEKK